MNVSREDLTTLERRRTVKPSSVPAGITEGWRDGVLTVFVPGRPHNALNNNARGWGKHERLRREWRERTANRLFLHHVIQGRGGNLAVGFWPWTPEAPKRITFTVYGPSRFDDDNLAAVCKSVRDALGPSGPRKPGVGLIHDDRPSAGHTFVYAQAKPTRTAGAVHGIAIRIELAP